MKEANQGAGLLTGDQRALTVGLVLIVTLVALEALAVATAMPLVQRDLGGLRLYGLVFSAFMVANLVGITVAGRLSDSIGPERPFLAGLVLFGLGLAAAGLSPNMPALVGARTVQGFGAGAVSTAVYVVIARAYDEALRPRMFAVLSTAWVVPGLVGPAVAAVIAEELSWRLVFLGLLPLLPLVAGLTLPALARLGPAHARSASPAQSFVIASFAAGAALFLAGLAAPTVVLAVPMVLIGLVLAAPALQRLLPAGTFRVSPGQPAAVATMTLLSLAIFGAESFLPLMLNRVRGQSPTLAGAALAVTTLTWTAGSWFAERRAETTSSRALVGAGLGLGFAGVVVILLVDLTSLAPGVAVAAWAVSGAGMGLSYPTLSMVVLGHAGAEQTGLASASLQLASVLGSAVGAGIGGAVISAGDNAGASASTSIAIVFAMMLAFLVVALGASRRLPATPLVGGRQAQPTARFASSDMRSGDQAGS